MAGGACLSMQVQSYDRVQPTKCKYRVWGPHDRKIVLGRAKRKPRRELSGAVPNANTNISVRRSRGVLSNFKAG